MKKRRKNKNSSGAVEASDVIRKQKLAKNKKYILPLIVNTLISLTVYWYLMEKPYFMVVLWVYFALTIGVTAAYIIYNRGFSRRNVTPEMLPDTMTLEEKTEFIADGERRLEKSKWLITVIFPLMMTFCLDVFYIFVVEPLLAGLGI